MKKLLLILATIGLLFSSCTENERAKSFGGDLVIDVPAGQKVTNITWKENELWYSTRAFREGETPEVITFHEESSWDVWEGTVTFKESK